MVKKKVSKLKIKLPAKKQTPNKRSEDGTRLRRLTKKQARHRKAELLKKEQKNKHLPNAWSIMVQALRQLYKYKKTFLGILFIYAVLYILFIKGVSANFQLGNLRKNLDATFDSNLNRLDAGVALFGLLLGTAGTSGTESAGVYQTVLLVITSMALIWALRVSFAGDKKIRIKDSFYKSTQSLVPFLAIFLIIVIQCLPALIVGSLYSMIETNSLAVGIMQKGISIGILLAGMLWTFYMLSSSLFALYIVTLPDAKPLASLRAAKKLVRFRRIIVLRKVIFLPILLLVFSGLILIPLIIFIPRAAEIVFLIFSILILGIVHGYLYNLYRYLINDKPNDKA